MLSGWKQIAAYLNREERTAMRWANERGLPVHRAPGRGRGSVYAIPAEIDAWLAAARQRRPETAAVAGPSEPQDVAGPSEPQAATTPVVPVAPTPRAAAGARRWWLAGGVLALGLLAMVGLRFTGDRSTDAMAAVDTNDPQAHAAVLRATYDWNQRTRTSLTQAVKEYGDAIQRDPRTIAAYIGLANTFLLLREDAMMPDGEAYPRAEAAARAATALAPSSPGPQRALAFVSFWWHGNRAAARRQFDRALALAPDDPLTHHWLATALSADGDQAEALREIGRARELDSTSTAIAADYGLIAYLAGRRAEGVATLREIEQSQPQAVAPHRALADVALFEGRGGEYLTELAATARLRGDARSLAEAQRLAGAGPDVSAIKTGLLAAARAQARGSGRQDGTAWYQLARTASLAGDRQQAAAALTRACAMHEPAAIAARGDLWLSLTLDSEAIQAICGGDHL